MSDVKSSLLQDARIYEIRVCSECRSSLSWCPDDGEGMSPRAWCNGSDRHLVVDSMQSGTHIQPLLIRTIEL